MALPGNKVLKVTASDALEFEPVVPEPPKRRLGLKAFMFLVVAAAGNQKTNSAFFWKPGKGLIAQLKPKRSEMIPSWSLM